jgi:hypothetical protein
MNLPNARLTVIACVEEALGETAAQTLTRDEQWMDAQLSELIQAAQEANPDGSKSDLEDEAVRAFGEGLIATLSAQK